MKRTAQIFFVTCFCLFLLGVGVLTALLPKETGSFYENRSLAALPEATAENILSGDFFTDLETYLKLDFMRDGLMKLYQDVQTQTRRSRMEEFMFLGLRMTKGVSDIDFTAQFGVKIRSVYGEKIDRLIANGLMREEGSRLMLTDWGIDISNYVLSEFLLDGE